MIIKTAEHKKAGTNAKLARTQGLEWIQNVWHKTTKIPHTTKAGKRRKNFFRA
jgi:hypothetical protein